MSRAGLRGRRTRVYDCNYNAGQNYIKPALDNLDRKYYGRPLLSDRIESSPRPSFFSPVPETSSPSGDDSLSAARRRAEHVIRSNEDSFFDVRGARVPKSSIGAAIEEFDDEFKSSLSRIRANKKATNFAADVDFDDAVNSIKRRNRVDLDSALDDSFASKASTSIKKSSYKLKSSLEEDSEPLSITKWTKLSSNKEADSNSSASLRAKATKARLDDLESEMFERSEKQLAREKRSQQLKQFLADSDITL